MQATSPWQVVQEKIMTHSAAEVWSNKLRSEQKSIVFTNGCFDILHAGHVQYLAEAKAKGDILIVGLNSDASVQRLKGKHRPIQDERARCWIIASLGFVDAVVVFDAPTPLKLIETLRPHVLIKGGDYKVDNIVGADFTLQNGGKVMTIPFLDGYSTSAIENKIKDH